MILEILGAVVIGIFCGVVTGLIPGLHVNLVAVGLLSVSGYLLLWFSPFALVVFIIAMAVTHTFLDALPAIFLGAPDADQVLNVLPGHRLLMNGQGYEAVKLTVVGSFLCILITVISIPVLIPISVGIFSLVNPVMGWILLGVSIFMILQERGVEKRVWALAIYLSAGILGVITFTMPGLKHSLVAMLSGLFGVSTLIVSLYNNVAIPPQEIGEKIVLSKRELSKIIFVGTLAGGITGLFPGIGAAQAGIIGAQLVGKMKDYAFLVLNGGINTVNFMFSIVTLYSLEKARNGAVIVILELMDSISLSELWLFLFVALLVGSICVFITLGIARVFSRLINLVDYKKLCFSIIVFVSGFVFVLSGWKGMLIMIVSTALGILPPYVNVRRNHAMGCLLMPVTMFFLF
jgi:putative membrane protein